MCAWSTICPHTHKTASTGADSTSTFLNFEAEVVTSSRILLALASPRMYSQEPRSRCSRIVANVTLEDVEGRAATVRSKFLMIEYRREQQRLFAGTAWHRLVQVEGAIRIAWKRVDLVNCDAPMDGLTQPF